MPKSLKERPWLIPLSILSLTLGIYIILTYAFPGFAPFLRERLAVKRLSVQVLALGLLEVALPILLLRLCVESDKEGAERDDDDDDLF